MDTVCRLEDVGSFSADVLLKRTGMWSGAKGVLVDRKPHGERTEFEHRRRRHTLALHLEGANNRAALRCDGRPQEMAGSTLGQVMLIPAEHQLDGWAEFPPKIRRMVLLLDPAMFACARSRCPLFDKLQERIRTAAALEQNRGLRPLVVR